jgi:hypothetical protein
MRDFPETPNYAGVTPNSIMDASEPGGRSGVRPGKPMRDFPF